MEGEKVGITGNRNWNAALMFVCITFAIYQTYKWIKHLTKNKNNSSHKKRFHSVITITITAITFILLSYSIYIIYKCESRGAVLSVLITALISVYCYFTEHLGKHKIRQIKPFFYVILTIFLLISIIFYIKHESINDEIRKSAFLTSLKNDVRLPLWNGTIHLIKDYPIFGTSPTQFESIFASYRPLEYFTKPNNAVRSDHPHNVLLYTAAVFGIPGFIIWCFLWIYPAIHCFSKFSKLSDIKRVILLSYCFLFLHGMLDLVLFHWPTIFLAAIFLGVLWQETFMNNANGISSNFLKKINTIIIKSLLILILIATLICLIYNLYTNYKAKLYYETGNFYSNQKKDFRAIYQYQRGLDYKINPKYLYKTGVTAIASLDNPELALYYFNYFNYIAPYDYAHKNGFIALSLLKTGNMKSTIPFLIKEVVNYPLSAGSWYRLYLMQKQLKMHDAAKYSLKNTYRALEIKNLPKKILPILLENPEYDTHPERIPKKRLKDIN